MCLAIPGKLEAITDHLDETFRIGKVSFDGIMKQVNLTMVPEAKVGDYVLVHVGAAIQVVDEKEARETFDILKKMGELDELEEP
jgi:hydrogenase expression/formation protein HypC